MKWGFWITSTGISGAQRAFGDGSISSDHPKGKNLKTLIPELPQLEGLVTWLPSEPQSTSPRQLRYEQVGKTDRLLRKASNVKIM